MMQITNILPSYTAYKPSWVPIELWEVWMYGLLGSYDTADMPPGLQREFNNMIVSRERAKVLEYILKKESVRKVKGQEGKLKLYQRGIGGQYSNNSYARSLAHYGNLFFGTKYGYHRDVTSIEGGTGRSKGSVILVLEMSNQDSKGSEVKTYTDPVTNHEHIGTLREIVFFTKLVVTYMMVEDAAYRSDNITLLVSNRPYASKLCYPQEIIPPPFKVPIINPIDGSPIKLDDGSQLEIDPYNEMLDWEPAINDPDDVHLIREKIAYPDEYPVSEDIMDLYYSELRTAQVTNAVKYGKVSQWDTESYGRLGEISPPGHLSYINSVKYDSIRNSILELSPQLVNSSEPLVILGFILKAMNTIIRTGERSTIIYMTSLQTPWSWLCAGPVLKKLNNYADIYILNFNEDKETQKLFDEPIFRIGGRNIIKGGWMGVGFDKLPKRIYDVIKNKNSS